MELHYYQYLLLLIVSLLITLLLLIGRRSQRPRGRLRLPPGPWELPVLGGIHHLLGSQLLPHRALQKLAQKHGPLMHLRLGEVSTIIISSAEVAREVFKTHDLVLSDRWQTNSWKVMTYGCKDLIFSHYGEYWRQLRKICVFEILSHKRVQSFRSIREEETLNLVRSISSENGSPINLGKMLYSLNNDITTRSVLGSRRNNNKHHQEAFLESLDELLKLTAGFSLDELFPSLPMVDLISGMRGKLLRCHQNIDQILEDILEEHKQRRIESTTTPTEDNLVDVLLKIQEDVSIHDQFLHSSDGLKALVLDIFAAGSETSANTMEWAMTELVRNPKVMKKAQAEVREVIDRKASISEDAIINELSYLKLVIKETLRLHTPLPLLVPRESRTTFQVLGYDIPEKAKVIVNAWAIGRDPQYWDDAEEFKPERFDGSPIDFRGASFEYLPFGIGRRMCPGISFGLASMELALARLLYHFDWKMPNGREPYDMDIEECVGTTVRRKFDLILCAIPRNPSCL